MRNQTVTGKNAFPGTDVSCRIRPERRLWRFVRRVIFLSFLWLVTAVSAAPWEKIEPRDAGFDPELLRQLDLYMRKNTGTTGLVVAVNGKIVHQYGDIQKISYIASCRKSVLAMLYGNAVANGSIRLDATMRELGIDDVGGLLPSEKEATVWDLITARSGIYHTASNAGGIPEGVVYERGKTPHGTRFVYNNWDFNAAGTVFEQQTHQSIYRALETQLAVPLGMEDFQFGKQKKGGNLRVSRHPAYHMFFSTRDMARLGELMRLEGRWNGQQLIPAEWCRRITAMHTPLNGGYNAGYGCMWWLLRDYLYEKEFKGAYTASGMFGQFITVLPSLNMVVAHKSAGNGKKPTSHRQYREILYQLLKAKGCRFNTDISKYHFLQVPGKPVAYLADHAVEKADPDAEYAVVFIHGANGGAVDPVRFLRNAIGKRCDPRKVYIVLPAFLTGKSCPEELLPKVALWSDGAKHDWRLGDPPTNCKGISSYEVVDIIFRHLSDKKRYPRLKHVLLAGFSAGGQFTNRYVAVGKLPLRKGIKASFAVGGPSTYLYYDLRRPDGNGGFRIPDMPPEKYNSWHLGLMNCNAYARNCSEKQVMKNICSRRTLYFCGEQDTLPAMLSVSPGAMLQGKNRIERFHNYLKYNHLFPQWQKCTGFFSYGNAGHSTVKVFSRPPFIDLVFGKWPSFAPARQK